jgi:hypothetical protein
MSFCARLHLGLQFLGLAQKYSLLLLIYYIQCVQKVWKHPNENVTHNFWKKSKDRSISVLKKPSADSVCSVFSMTLKKLLCYKKNKLLK